MNPDLIGALKELERERGISFEIILGGLEDAMASAYKTWYHQQHPDLEEEMFDVRAKMDPESGEMLMWIVQLDEDGQPVSEEPTEVTDEFKGRIGAQVAKQVIYQKM